MPWYQSCGAKAVGTFLLHGGIDAAAAIPVAGTAITATQIGLAVANTDWSDSTKLGNTSKGLTLTGSTGAFVGMIPSIAEDGSRLAEGIPILGIAVGAISVGIDAYNAYHYYSGGCKEGS